MQGGGEVLRSWDAYGVEMVPIRLVVSIAVIGAVVGLCVAGFALVRPAGDAGVLRGECEGAVGMLAGLVRGGVPRDLRDPDAALGTRRVVSFNVPAGCVYLSFGGDPDPEGDGRRISSITGTGAVIVFQVQGAGKEVFWLTEPVGFRAGIRDGERYKASGGSLVLQSCGKATLVFELVRDAEEMYILVYPAY
jgi:hypothetical protein